MSEKKKLVVFSGAGVSAESGLKTFRDAGGLWENFDVMEVASIDGWNKNPELVLEFYTMRYKQLKTVKPNAAHKSIADLEDHFDVTVVTQNVDDLHERAGSSNVIHLHGELNLCRGVNHPQKTYPMPEGGIKIGQLCPEGGQMRPHIVWFGEMVPELDRAAEIVKKADIFIVVGTSLNVYPAAGLADHASGAVKYLVDPGEFAPFYKHGFKHIKEKASVGIPILASEIINEFTNL